MGIFSAMLTGISGLQGQSTKMGAISDNIANVNTVGYKKADVPFQTMVTERITSTNYAPGGVLSRPRILVDKQGTISASTSATDIAVSGRGFFVVTDDPTGATDATKFYTRAGSFKQVIDPNSTAKALLRNVAGFYLMGWPTDRDGNIQVNANLTSAINASPTIGDLVPVDVYRITNVAEPTTDVGWRGNLPAEVSATGDTVSYYIRSGQGTAASPYTKVAYSFTAAGHTGAGVATVNLGVDPALTVNVNGSTVNFNANDLDNTSGLTAGGGAAFATGGTVAALLTRLNGLTKGTVTLAAQLTGSGELLISASDSSGANAQVSDINATLAGLTFNANEVAISAGAEDGFETTFAADVTHTFTVYDALGAAHNVTYGYKKRLEEPNLWEVRISDSGVAGLQGSFDPNSSTTVPNNGARFVVNDGANTALQTQRLFLKFEGNGALREVRTDINGSATAAAGNTTYLTTMEGQATSGIVVNRQTDAAQAPKLVSVAIGPVTTGGTRSTDIVGPVSLVTGPVFGPTATSPNTPVSSQAIVFDWDLGRPTINWTSGTSNVTGGTGLDAVTQFDSGEAAPALETFFFNQNGARAGNLNDLAIDEDGFLVAHYDNGLSRKIWRLPVATFANPNGMINQSGNVFLESEKSGQVQLKFSGKDGAGRIFGASVENSNVDLGDEFTDMIVTQQAFTANTRVITTSDRMLEELVRILR